MTEQKKRPGFSNSGLLSPVESFRLATMSPRVALNVLQERLRLHSHGRAPYPYLFVLMLTDRCNFACPMCSVGLARKLRLEEHKKDMDFKFVEQLVYEARNNGAIVQLFGGEPLLYERLDDLFALTRKNRVITFITTNGLLLEQKAVTLINGGINVLQVSLDGWDEESQKLRGNVAGGFDAIVQGIAKIRDLRPHGIFPILRITTVITKANFHSLDRIGQCIQDLGIKEWIISNYFFITKDAVHAHNQFLEKTSFGKNLGQHEIETDHYLSRAEIDELRRSLTTIRKRCQSAGIRLSYPWGTDLDAYYSPTPPSRQSVCGFIGNRIEIYSDGRIGICSDGLTIGHLKEGSVRSAWNGERMKSFLKVFKERGILPMCFRCCGIVQNIIQF